MDASSKPVFYTFNDKPSDDILHYDASIELAPGMESGIKKVGFTKFGIVIHDVHKDKENNDEERAIFFDGSQKDYPSRLESWNVDVMHGICNRFGYRLDDLVALKETFMSYAADTAGSVRV